MNNKNFLPLQRYSTIFRLYVWARRFRMITFRLAFVALIVYVLFFLPPTISVRYSGSLPLDPLGLWIFIVLVSNPLLSFWMSQILYRFALANGMEVIGRADVRYPGLVTVPSFRSKLLAMTSEVAVESSNNARRGIFTRIYKEGGVLRWRERRMDTIAFISLPAQLPHIVIDSRVNERTRKTNLTSQVDATWKFNFEGVRGEHYDVYAAPEQRVVALQLFTPDVLNVLYEKFPDVDIEVSGTTIWFIKRYGVLDDALGEELWSAVIAIEPQLVKQVQSAQLTNN